MSWGDRRPQPTPQRPRPRPRRGARRKKAMVIPGAGEITIAFLRSPAPGLLGYAGADLTTSDNLFFIAFFATMIQIGMAFYAMSSLSLIGYFSGAIVAIYMICSNKTLRLPDHCATPQAFAA